MIVDTCPEHGLVLIETRHFTVKAKHIRHTLQVSK